MPQPTQLFADDLPVGFRFKGEPILLTSEMFKRFSQITADHHPIHDDEAYAAKTVFGRPVAHGLLLASLTALGATTLGDRLQDSMVALVGEAFRFQHPAFVGDTLTVEFECKAVSSTRDPGKKKVEFHVRVINQGGVAVAEGSHTYLLKSRST